MNKIIMIMLFCVLSTGCGKIMSAVGLGDDPKADTIELNNSNGNDINVNKGDGTQTTIETTQTVAEEKSTM